MFSKHLFKVIISFCGMIILGLAMLVIIDSFKEKNTNEIVDNQSSVGTEDSKMAPVKVQSSLKKSTPIRTSQ